MADQIQIPGAPRNPYIARPDVRYDYDADKSRCPCCGGLGIPWGGWFRCESCAAIAVVGDGRVFVPAEVSG